MAEKLVLKKADLIAAARKAYDEKRLSAQGPTPECAYRDKSGRPCAIGAAMPDEWIAAHLRFANGGVLWLQQNYPIRFETPDFAARLQAAHDQWADGIGTEDAFRTLIGLPPLSGDR